MKCSFLLIALCSLAAVSATAGTINFDTTGSQLCTGAIGCGSTTVTFGQTIITYRPNLGETESTPSFVNLGSLVISCVGGGTACASNAVPTGLTLYVNVNQTAPPAGSGFISGGGIAGTLSGTSSTALITWAPGAKVDISTSGNVTTTYAILNPILGLVPPANNNCGPSCAIQPSGLTTIQGQVTQTAPEPGSILLLSTGMAGFLLARKRRS